MYAVVPSKTLHGSASAALLNVQHVEVTWILAAEVCAKMAASAQGKPHSEATKQKIAAGRRAVAQKKAAANAEPKAGAARSQAGTARFVLLYR